MNSAPLRYIGDISREDAQLLSRYAASRVQEERGRSVQPAVERPK